MLNLNSASIEDIAAAGIAPNVARAVAFWGPFRTWEDLLWINEIDDAVLTRLRARGFEIKPPVDRDLPAPKPFRLSASAAPA
jgi:DNA uptake protein ComE-like DNA-binding protein